MARFLTDAWVAELDHVARTVTVPADARLTIDFDVDGFHYHLAADADGLRLHPGTAAAADVAFAFDRATAQAIATGELQAQAAFMNGHIRISGRPRALLTQVEVLTALGTVWRESAPATEY